MSEARLAALAPLTVSLTDRLLGAGRGALRQSESPADAAARGGAIEHLVRWRMAGRRGPADLAARLAAHGLPPGLAPRLVDPRWTVADMPRPDWLDDACFASEALKGLRALDLPPSQEAMPFGPIAAAVAAAVVRDLARARPDAPLTAAAWSQMADRLATPLIQLLSVLLGMRFMALRDRAPDRLKALPPVPGAPPDRRLMAAFTQSLLSTGLLDLAEELPMLPRLLGGRIAVWRRSMNALLDDLIADFREAAELAGARSGRIDQIKCDASDFHNGGRAVAILTFECGARIVYKPRSLAPDIALKTVAERLVEAGVLERGFRHRFADKGARGWMSFVAPEPLGGDEDAERYFEACGALEFLAALTGLSDLIGDNILPTRDGPQPIDAEVMLAFKRDPGAKDQEAAGLDAITHLICDRSEPIERRQRLFASIVWSEDFAGRLGNCWQDDENDKVRLGPEPPDPQPKPHWPRIGDAFVAADRWRGEILAGFEAAYRRFIASGLDADALLADALAESRPRVVVRATEYYVLMQARAETPRALTSGITHSIEFEHLFRDLRERDADPAAHALAEAEIAALEAGDIPYFTARPDERQLYHAYGPPIRDFLPLSPMERQRARWRRMGEADLAAALERLESLSRPPAGL